MNTNFSPFDFLVMHYSSDYSIATYDYYETHSKKLLEVNNMQRYHYRVASFLHHTSQITR